MLQAEWVVGEGRGTDAALVLGETRPVYPPGLVVVDPCVLPCFSFKPDVALVGRCRCPRRIDCSFLIDLCIAGRARQTIPRDITFCIGAVNGRVGAKNHGSHMVCLQGSSTYEYRDGQGKADHTERHNILHKGGVSPPLCRTPWISHGLPLWVHGLAGQGWAG
jgi:hypothetical protein